MPRRMLVPFLCFSLLWGAACATTSGARAGASANSDAFVFGGDDDAKAAVLLGDWLKKHQITVTQVAQGDVGVAVNGWRILLSPKMYTGGEIDRFVTTLFFAPQDKWKGSKELRDFANDLNVRWNIGGFYVDTDGDLVLQTALTFEDQVSWDEMKGYFDWLTTTMVTLGSKEKGMALYMQ